MTKWYLDAIADDGATGGYFYFIEAKIAGFPYGEVSAHLFSGTDAVVHRTWHRKPDRPAPDERVAFGASRLRRDSDSIRMTLSHNDFEADLRYGNPGVPFVPAGGSVLAGKRGGTVRWQVPGMSCTVSGTLRIADETSRFRGRGYIDVVEVTIPPWRLPIAELAWGRAHCGPYAAVYDRIAMRDGIRHDILHVRNGADPVLETTAFTLEEGTDSTILRADGMEMSLMQLRTLEENSVLTPERTRPAFLRVTLARMTGNPSERKRFSAAHLRIGGTAEDGFAVHETVRWRW